MSAVAPYEATVVLIHHSSKSREGERASNTVRGSNALTAAVDQLVNLKWHSDKDEDPRVELHTEGRGDKPIHLVIEQGGRYQWVLHGNAHEINTNEAREKQKNQLNERQGKVLRAVNHAWEKEHREVYSRTLREELEVKFSPVIHDEKAVRDTLDQLTERDYWINGRPRLRERVTSFYSDPMALIFLNPIHRLYGNTLQTLRSLLYASNPRKVLFTLILILEKLRRIKRARECFYKAKE